MLLRMSAFGFALVVCGVLLIACSGNGGDPVADFDGNLTGWWELKVRPSGASGAYQTVEITQMQQTGNTVVSEGGDPITISGNSIREADPNETDPDRTVTQYTIVSNDLVIGSSEEYENGVVVFSIEMRMERRTAPSGTFSGSGLLDGESVGISTSNGFATWSTVQTFPRSNLTICDSRPTTFCDVEIGYESSAALSPGTYLVDGLEGLDVSVDTPDAYDWAESGSVTFEVFSPTHIRGTGTVSLIFGDTFTFSFDVDILASYSLEDIFDVD